MKGLDELRHKESDRINSISVNLKKVGRRKVGMMTCIYMEKN